MLIKFDFPNHLAVKLKLKTGCMVGSKAASQACRFYLDQLDLIAQLKSERDRLQDEVNSLVQTLEGARSSAAQLLEKCGQDRLF